ncbi:MAG: oligoendopeptidase F [Ignavibacteriaceae bacterium]|nr:oligoendopeptidase F [Ignavibacteriaceae bacterium]
MKLKLSNLLTLLVILFLSTSFPQNLQRKDVPEKYKWNLSEIYPSRQAWLADKDNISKMIDEIVKYKGHLAESPDQLLNALKTYFDASKSYSRLADYASRISDEDLRISENQELLQSASTLGTDFSEKTSFISPEILKMDPSKIETFFKDKPALQEYKMFIADIQRLREHTLSEAEENLLASFGLISDTPVNVYNIFNNAEQPVAKISLSTGEKVNLTSSAYTKYRSVSNREDRELIFRSFFNNYEKFKNTLGADLDGKIKTDFVYAKDRKYNSSMESSLSSFNVPVSVYENLVKQIHNSLPTLYRVLDLKKKLLGVDTLHYYDLYTSIAKKVDMKYSVDEGEKTILDALKPMGPDYIKNLKFAYDHRWVDLMPNEGKRSGAYESGASYDVHPYILTNWNGDYESVTTLAHESGHMMHSFYSNKNQTYPNSQYPIFVAEIASTTNETLLNNYMVKNAKNDDERLFLLGNYLDLLRNTIFRQTMFAEFEWEIHKVVEKGEPLTGEQMSNIYYNIVKTYYGNDQGKCIVDPYVAYEWEYIPHFFNYTYYVYQYATSLIYATAFAEKIVNEGQPAVDKYYNILKGGYSDYPLNLIKKAGIDPLSSEAFEITMKKMNKVMDQIEEIIAKKK